MPPSRTLARTLTGWLVACLVMLFASTTALDGLLCGGEDAAHGPASAQLTLSSAEIGHVDAAGHGSGAIHLCAHGHCHHAAAPASDDVRLVASSDDGGRVLSPRNARVPDSAILGRDKPPPRA